MPNPKLLILSDILRGESFEITKDSFIIGRSEQSKINNDLVINDLSISSQHANITKKGNKYYLQDLNSTNGTSINGTRLVTEKEYLLGRGNILQFGLIEAVFNIEDKTDFVLKTDIDLTKALGNLDESLLTTLSPLFSSKNNENKKTKYIVRYLLIFMFILIIVLMVFILL